MWYFTSMFRNLVAPITGTLILCAGLLCLLLQHQNFEAVHFYLETAFIERETWFPVVHTSINSYTLWRLDPFLAGAFAWVMPAATEVTVHYLLFCLAICTAGIFCLLNYCYGRIYFVTHLAGALAFPAALMLIWGNHLILLTAFTWFPWLILAAIIAAHHPGRKFLGLMLTVYFSYRMTMSACHLAPVLAIIALVIVYYLIKINPLHQYSERIPSYNFLLVLTLLIPPVLSMFFFPVPNFPAYDTLTHVVPDDGLAGNILPLVGPAPPIPLIHRTLLKSLMAAPVLVIFSLLLVWGFLRANEEKGKSLFFPAVLLAAFLGVDILLPEAISQLAPIAVLERVIPFQFFIPLVEVTLACCLFFVLLGIRAEMGVIMSWVAAAVAGYFCIIGASYPGIIAVEGHNRAQKELIKRLNSGVWTEEEAKHAALILVSPSYYLLNQEGLWILDSREIIAKGKFRHFRHTEPRLTSSHRNIPEELWKMVRRVPHSRWYAGGGSQTGNEWLHIELPEVVQLKGVELSTEEFHTDFPRGVSVKYSEDCGSEAGYDNYKEAYRRNIWDGPIGITSGGYPYLGSQGIVKIYFKDVITARCILVQQIGTSQHYDWSIARLRLLSPDPDKTF